MAKSKAPVDTTQQATVALVNKALRERGFKEKLVAGRGYYYFVDGRSFDPGVDTTSIYVYRISQVTIQWVLDHHTKFFEEVK